VGQHNAILKTERRQLCRIEGLEIIGCNLGEQNELSDYPSSSKSMTTLSFSDLVGISSTHLVK